MKTLRIALFTYSTKPRGGVIHTLELAEALQEAGQEVCIYALDKDNIGFHRPLKCPSKLVPTQPAADSIDKLIEQRIAEFIDYLSNETDKYDIYHSQDCISANALKVLRDQQMIPSFLRTVHHIDDFNSPYLQECHDRSIQEPDLCLCVSQYWQEQLQQQYKVSAPVIINGINTQRFSSDANGSERELKQRLGITGDHVYLSIGGIEPRKNSLRLLQAFSQILKVHPQAQLVIAGGETLFDYQPYRNEFFTIAKQHQIHLGESLLLPGVMSDQDIPVLYRCADAFVFPSVKEGWGLVLLEAIASGLPVITSNIAPFTEFLSSQQALLVKPHSSNAIAQAMLDILDKNLAQQLIRNSKAIPSQYSWQKSAQIHLKLYQKLKQDARN
ncbi:glycosyltransferase, MSMEG_0565 family [Xenococcus sp. PCC 7305]|uniref:MSMEG_0565 family glycosyltransferase n=1 Tax=Xenococcus sp. PCC 7305 TaxID=102125 RepID=UPI0002AC0201|nr:MSMEG_0565 family glycosyltransferase [Xenococcus sp. PCC 7305]ELS03927.1 glycosyltransferase, MSMEG_0565 family [Xenococcus sp. PCC 7305]